MVVKSLMHYKFGIRIYFYFFTIRSIYFSEGRLVNIFLKYLPPGIDLCLSKEFTKDQSLFFLLSKSWDLGPR